MTEHEEEKERRTRRIDTGDDVEGHGLRKSRIDNEEDDVEGHGLRKSR